MWWCFGGLMVNFVGYIDYKIVKCLFIFYMDIVKYNLIKEIIYIII